MSTVALRGGLRSVLGGALQLSPVPKGHGEQAQACLLATAGQGASRVGSCGLTSCPCPAVQGAATPQGLWSMHEEWGGGGPRGGLAPGQAGRAAALTQ